MGKASIDFSDSDDGDECNAYLHGKGNEEEVDGGQHKPSSGSSQMTEGLSAGRKCQERSGLLRMYDGKSGVHGSQGESPERQLNDPVNAENALLLLEGELWDQV